MGEFFHRISGMGILASGGHVGEFFPQEFRQGSSSDRSSCIGKIFST
jgi:hypothetical protein